MAAAPPRGFGVGIYIHTLGSSDSTVVMYMLVFMLYNLRGLSVVRNVTTL